MDLYGVKKIIQDIELSDGEDLNFKFVNTYIEHLNIYINLLEKEVKEQSKYANRYHILESWGVDNWQGYDGAREEWNKLEEQDQ